MDEIEKRLDLIEKKIDIIMDTLLNNVDKNCEKMGNHINFIEKVYDNVKNPLYFICNKINNITRIDKHKIDM